MKKLMNVTGALLFAIIIAYLFIPRKSRDEVAIDQKYKKMEDSIAKEIMAINHLLGPWEHYNHLSFSPDATIKNGYWLTPCDFSTEDNVSNLLVKKILLEIELRELAEQKYIEKQRLK